jgi:hypothetical protein
MAAGAAGEGTGMTFVAVVGVWFRLLGGGGVLIELIPRLID